MVIVSIPVRVCRHCRYLDRENQGGWFPTWLMNRTKPRYLSLQAEAVRRFFDAGGPAALKTPAGP